MSICGRSTATEDLEGYSDEEEDEFAAAIEMLYEKRAATRESGLQKLIRLLTSQWQLDECTFKQETLKRLFLGCFKRGAAAESALAARALGKLRAGALTLGRGISLPCLGLLIIVFFACCRASHGHPWCLF